MKITKQSRAIEVIRTKKPCVYLLTDEKGEIVYVGKSKKSLFGRVAAHEYDKSFESVFFIECAGFKEMDELEARLIREANPKYNRAIDRHAAGLISFSDVKKEIKVDKRIIKRAASERGIGMVMVGSVQYFEKGIVEAVREHLEGSKRKPLSWKNGG